MSAAKTETNKAGENGAASSESKRNATSCLEHWEDSVHSAEGQELYRKFKEADRKAASSSHSGASDSSANGSGSDNSTAPKKRGLGANQKGTKSSKRPKHDEKSEGGQPTGIAGDKTRVPAKGQKVQWHSLPGWVDGEVVEVVYEHKTVEGKTVKGSKEDPRVVVKSEKSGKVAVHKPEAVYFD